MLKNTHCPPTEVNFYNEHGNVLKPATTQEKRDTQDIQTNAKQSISANGHGNGHISYVPSPNPIKSE
jgi:hypothetical protein